MPNNKITKKNKYSMLYNIVAADTTADDDTKNMLYEFINHEVELLDQRSEKNKNYQQTHKATNDPMTDMIVNTLSESDKPLNVLDIVEKIVDSTPQKIIYRLGELFNSGRINKTVQTIKLEDNTSRRVTYYTLIPEEQE